jgi:hypothetical protein
MDRAYGTNDNTDVVIQWSDNANGSLSDPCSRSNEKGEVVQRFFSCAALEFLNDRVIFKAMNAAGTRYRGVVPGPNCLACQRSSGPFISSHTK